MVYIKTKEGASLWIALLATAIVAGTMTLLDAVWWVTLCVCGAVFVVVALVALFIIRKYVAYKLKPIYSIVLSRDVLTIEGVGVLKFKNFTLAPAFDRLLNPQGHEPVRIKPARRLDWALWVGIAAIVIAAGFGGAEFLRINSSDIPEPGAAAEVARTLPAADAGIPADSSATAGVTDDGTATAVAGTKAAETDVAGSSAAGAAGTADSAGDRADAAVTRADAKPAGLRPGSAARVSTEPASLVSGHRYVVLGVFSTPENAARAAADAEARDASVRCGVYRFGNKFMVSPFEAPDAEACTLFIRNYSDRFPGLWTYTAR